MSSNDVNPGHGSVLQSLGETNQNPVTLTDLVAEGGQWHQGSTGYQEKEKAVSLEKSASDHS